MPLSTFQTDIAILGNLSVNSLSMPPASVGNTAIQTPSPASQGIAPTKVIHYLAKEVTQPLGTAVVAATNICHVVFGSSCTIAAVTVMLATPPTSSDTVTVDVKKGNTSTVYTSILTAPLVLSSSSVSKTVYNATLATTTATTGDSFTANVGVSGASAEGMIVSLVLYESAV